MSVDNVSRSPRTCSGLAQESVNGFKIVVFDSLGLAGSSKRAIPKSSTLIWPSAVTRMLEGFRSRCMIRF